MASPHISHVSKGCYRELFPIWRVSEVPESNNNVEVDQGVAERDGLREQLVDLRLLVADLLKENQRLRGRLGSKHLLQTTGFSTEQETW